MIRYAVNLAAALVLVIALSIACDRFPVRSPPRELAPTGPAYPPTEMVTPEPPEAVDPYPRYLDQPPTVPGDVRPPGSGPYPEPTQGR